MARHAGGTLDVRTCAHHAAQCAACPDHHVAITAGLLPDCRAHARNATQVEQADRDALMGQCPMLYWT